jgi:adenylyltransferase/sulfurtransferase
MRANGLPHLLVDVRSAAEYAICHIEGSLLIPLDELAPRLAQLPTDRPLIVHCKTGPRSRQAVKMMRQIGLKQARTLDGGILAWAKAYDQTLALY